MTDKERILSAVVAAIIPCIMFATEEEQKEVVKHCLFNPHELKKGGRKYKNKHWQKAGGKEPKRCG